MTSVRQVIGYLPASMQKLWMFYCGLSSGNKSAVWLANGILFGSIYGTRDRLKTEQEKKVDYLEATEFNVPQGRAKEFEKLWNDSAKRTQIQRGYGWTRTYKAIAWEDSPFQYLTMRQWEGQPVEDHIFAKKLEESGFDAGKKTEFITVVDDSVIRTIS